VDELIFFLFVELKKKMIKTIKNFILELFRTKNKTFEVKKCCVEIMKQIGTKDYYEKVLDEVYDETRNEIHRHGSNQYFEIALEMMKVWDTKKIVDKSFDFKDLLKNN
jgi:hypothetical protein